MKSSGAYCSPMIMNFTALISDFAAIDFGKKPAAPAASASRATDLSAAPEISATGRSLFNSFAAVSVVSPSIPGIE